MNLPFALRVELVRMRRLPAMLIEHRTMALTKSTEALPFCLAEHRSPLHRNATHKRQRGKERNVAIAVDRFHNLLIEPNRILSYHHIMGRPSRLRGFKPGLELHRHKLARGIGGGLCQVSNLLYWLALNAGMRIVERHRHSLDLFPDHQRAVPFGCGATVFYNTADLRFENPLPQKTKLHLQIHNQHLIGALYTEEDPGWRTEIIETDHRFYQTKGTWMRENRITRRFHTVSGTLLFEAEVAHNKARVCYEL